MELLDNINNLINFLQNIDKEDELDLTYGLTKFIKDIPIHHQAVVTDRETVEEEEIVLKG